MTMAIAAFGPGADRAVSDGVLAAELLGRGAIGGFAVLSVLDADRAHFQTACQDGGVAALARPAAEGVICAAIISSGPNRPEPLSQFLAGRSGLGLVTGHRLPNRIGAEGRAVNASALERMARGASPAAAVAAELEANPELDFGLIAVDPGGGIGFGDSKRVARRADLGRAARIEPDRGYALLFNSIYCAPGLSLSRALGDIVWSRLSGEEAAFSIAELAAPAPLIAAAEDRIELDGDDRVTAIRTANPRGLDDSDRTTVIYLRAPVWRNGRPTGAAASEIFARVEGGRAIPDPARQRRFIVERSGDVAP
ncbi:MAG: DUF6963 family protein [Pikeienuella sp.]